MATKAEKTREFILQASYPLFARNGFKQVTMKDVCEATNLSRGGLYSHFPGTAELFKELLGYVSTKDAMDFDQEMKKGSSAALILENALTQMEEEMKKPQDSLSTAIYEYAETIDNNVLTQYNLDAVRKWSSLIRYGIKRGEFREVDVNEIVNIILFSYQGIRMWSRVISVKPETVRAILSHIRKELINDDHINKTGKRARSAGDRIQTGIFRSRENRH